MYVDSYRHGTPQCEPHFAISLKLCRMGNESGLFPKHLGYSPPTHRVSVANITVKKTLSYKYAYSPNQLFSGRSLRTVTAVCHISLSLSWRSSSFNLLR